MPDIAYVGLDAGPRRTLAALAEQLPGRWLGEDASLGDARLLICGTSDTQAGRSAEAAARREASRRGVPRVVIEDFPGNFAAVEGGAPNLLVVESPASASLARSKIDGRVTAIEVCPAIRYDSLRQQLDAVRRRPETNAILWIGQPETRDALATLQALMPALAGRDAVFWFRAHPRDEGYGERAYHDVLWDTGIYVEDMTGVALEACLTERPRLVVTQFSSVAIEAGFLAVPGFNILLPGAGGSRLHEKKGYAVPPWCEEGAAFLATSVDRIGPELERALASESARSDVQGRFDRYFAVKEEGIPRLLNVLYNQGFPLGPKK